jgi:hypothetical protein
MTRARANEDAFDALVSCMAMTARRGEFATLAMPLDPEYRVEGWTWAPAYDEDSPTVRAFADILTLSTAIR